MRLSESIERQCVVGGHPGPVTRRGEPMMAKDHGYRDDGDMVSVRQRYAALLASEEAGLRCEVCEGWTDYARSLLPSRLVANTCLCPTEPGGPRELVACPECWGWMHKARGDGGCRCEAAVTEWCVSEVVDTATGAVVERTMSTGPQPSGSPFIVGADEFFLYDPCEGTVVRSVGTWAAGIAVPDETSPAPVSIICYPPEDGPARLIADAIAADQRAATAAMIRGMLVRAELRNQYVSTRGLIQLTSNDSWIREQNASVPNGPEAAADDDE